MEKTVTREVKIHVCDVCDQEADSLGRCSVCGKEMCYSHWAYSLGKIRKHTSSSHPPVASLKICKECAGLKPDLTIEELMDGMISSGPIKLLAAS